MLLPVLTVVVVRELMMIPSSAQMVHLMREYFQGRTNALRLLARPEMIITAVFNQSVKIN